MRTDASGLGAQGIAAGARAGRGRVASLLLGLVLALAAAEVLLRLQGPELPCYRLDPELLHDAVPGGSRVQRMPDPNGTRVVEVAFNEFGLRGPLPRVPRDRPRVLLVGDSLVLAGNTREEQTLRAELERRLGEVEVLNAGRESYGPDQTLLWLRRRLREVEPDLVVLVLCAHNDLGDLVRNRLFRLGPGGILERERTALAPTLIEDFEARARPAGGSRLLAWLRRRTVPVAPETTPDPQRLLQAWLDASKAQARDAAIGPPLVVDLEHDTYDADVALQPGSETARAKRALMTAVLQDLRVELELEGVDALAVVVPSAVDAVPTYPVRPDPGTWPDYAASNLTGALSGCAQEAGWSVVDATAALETMGSEAFEAGLDFHWSAAGQAVTAELLEPRVAQLLGL